MPNQSARGNGQLMRAGTGASYKYFATTEPPLMQIIHRDPPARVERYRTSEGKEFVIRRRPRRGRKYQKPQLTGERLLCPYCSQEHDVVYFLVAKGRKGKKKVRTWICPKVGKCALNPGRQWDEYIESIIVRQGSQVGSSARREVQTSQRGSSPEAQPPSTVEIPEETSGGTVRPEAPPGQEPKPRAEVTRPRPMRSIAESPATALVQPARTTRARRPMPDSYLSAIRRFIPEPAPSFDEIGKRLSSRIKRT